MRIIFLMLTIALASTLSAQDLTATWGEANKNKSFINRILGETDTEVLTLASKGEEFYIETYDKNTLNIKESYPFTLPKEMNKKTDIEFIHYFPQTKKIIVLTSLYHKKLNTIYSYTVSHKGELSNSTSLLEIPVENKGRQGRFGFVESDDENSILVYHTSKLRKEKMKQVRVKVIDANGELVADLSDKIPMKEDKKEVYVNDFTFDSDGYIHMLVTKPTRQYKDYFFYTYNSKDNYKKKTYQIELDKDHVVNEVAFTVNATNNLVAAGYYSYFAGIFKGLTIQGVFSFEYNPRENKVLSKKLSAYTPRDVLAAFGEKKAKQMRKGIPPNFFLKDIVLKANGGLVLVGESVLIVQSNNGPVSTTTYIYGDIMVTDLDNKGNINFLQSIPKKQIFTRPSLVLTVGDPVGSGGTYLSFSIALMKDKSVFLSYMLVTNEDNLYFVYNDNPKNVENLDYYTDKPKAMKNLNKGLPTVVKMSAEGKVERQAFPGAKNDELVLRPRINKRVDAQTIYVYGNKKKLDKIGRITVQ